VQGSVKPFSGNRRKKAWASGVHALSSALSKPHGWISPDGGMNAMKVHGYVTSLSLKYGEFALVVKCK